MSSSSASSSSSFPLWRGSEDRAAAPARFVDHLFDCSPPSASSSSESLRDFIAYAMNRTQVPAAVLTGALCLLHRLKSRFSQAKASSANRLFLAAFMIAQKQLCDGSFSSASWCVVARNRWSLRDVNRMEKEMLEYLSWSVTLSASEMSQIDHIVYRDYCSSSFASTSSQSSSSHTYSSSASTSLPSPSSSHSHPHSSSAADIASYPSPISHRSYSPSPSSSEHALYSSIHSSSSSSVDTPLHTPAHSATPSECESDWSPTSSSAELDGADSDIEDDEAAERKSKLVSCLRRNTLTPATASAFGPQFR